MLYITFIHKFIPLYIRLIEIIVLLLQFIESMEQKYHEQAEEAGVFVVSACGFDSIPLDVGMRFTEENFSGM